MTGSSTRIGFQLFFVLTALALIWLSLRGIEMDEFARVLRTANYAWLAPVVAVTLLSHWIRAVRWRILLSALPDGTERRFRVGELFSSVMIGYMVNYALPRVGEVARCAHLSARQDLPLAGVIGTVVSERAMDIMALVIGLSLSAWWLRGRTEALIAQLELTNLTVWAVVAGAGIVLAVLVFQFRRVVLHRLRPLLRSFMDGLATVFRSRMWLALSCSTVLIWLMYGLMAYLPLLMFNLHSAFELTLMDGLAIMFIGVIGVVVPTPGGAGSFHYITILSLGVLYSIPNADAAAYAIFVHGAQLILYGLVGAAALVWKPAPLRIRTH